MKVQELLKDESCWIKGSFSRNKDRNDAHVHTVSVPELEYIPVCWCLSGAMQFCGVSNIYYLKVMNKLQVEYGIDPYSTGIAGWNDDPKTTFQDVRRIIEELDI